MTDVRTELSRLQAQITERTPLGRFGTTEEIASAVALMYTRYTWVVVPTPPSSSSNPPTTTTTPAQG